MKWSAGTVKIKSVRLLVQKNSTKRPVDLQR